MVWQRAFVVHVYLQKPAMHCFGTAEVPPHCASVVQLGFGRVSGTQAPWLQYWPSLHAASVVHAATHWPLTQLGALAFVHCAFSVHVDELGASGTQTPCEQAKPSAQAVDSQLGRHRPSAQTFPGLQSLA